MTRSKLSGEKPYDFMTSPAPQCSFLFRLGVACVELHLDRISDEEAHYSDLLRLTLSLCSTNGLGFDGFGLGSGAVQRI